MRSKSPEAQYAKAFDLSIAQSTPQFFESNPKKAEETEQARSQLMDFRGKYFANIPHERGGELMMQHFGPPGVLKNQALLLDGQHVVYVDDVTMEMTLEGMQTGRWHIKYRHQ